MVLGIEDLGVVVGVGVKLEAHELLVRAFESRSVSVEVRSVSVSDIERTVSVSWLTTMAGIVVFGKGVIFLQLFWHRGRQLARCLKLPGGKQNKLDPIKDP